MSIILRRWQMIPWYFFLTRSQSRGRKKGRKQKTKIYDGFKNLGVGWGQDLNVGFRFGVTEDKNGFESLMRE